MQIRQMPFRWRGRDVAPTDQVGPRGAFPRPKSAPPKA